jgi:filamentous hemagglutinin family protein
VVRSGAASIARSSGASLTVSQTSSKAIIDWRSFSVGQGATVRFDNGSGATLNRVTGTDLSSIDGLLAATGSVYLINPNGVVIGKSGVVNTGGSFVASTLGLANASFLAGGPLTFSGPATTSAVNLGKVSSLGGNVALIATTVENDGAISAPKGDVGLIAGSTVTMDDADNDAGGLFSVQVGGFSTRVTNTGAIAAAAAELRTQQGNVYALAGNTGGVIAATGVDASGGKVLLIAEDGTVTASGTISATAANGSGGQVETSGRRVDFAGLTVKAGSWLVDPTNLTVDDAAAASIDQSLSAGTSVTLQTTASGAAGPGVTSSGAGDIIVATALSWSTNATLTLNAYHAIAIDAPISVTGAGGVVLDAANETIAGASVLGLSFANSASINYGATNNGGTLSINGQRYTLLYLLSEPGSTGPDTGTNDIAGIDNNTAAGGLKGYYALATDVTQASGQVFTGPLVAPGTNEPAGYVQGVFEGLGNTITGLTIADPANDERVSLFANLANGGTIRDLGLVGGSVALTGSGALGGSGYVAGLVANNNGVVVNVYSTGAVSGGQSDTVGSVVGMNYGGAIINSYAAGPVSGGDGAEVGDLDGANHGGTILDSYATGSATGGANAYVGGLAGEMEGGSISQSYATGNVSGGSGAFLAGLVYNKGGTITDGYYDANTSGQPVGTQSDGSVGLTTAQLQGGLPSGFSTAAWGENPGAYPALLSFSPSAGQSGSVAGIVYGATPGAVLSGVEVEIVLNGSTVLGTATTGSGGAYSLAVPVGALSAGDTLTVYLMDGTVLANAVAEDIGGPGVTGLNLVQNDLLVRTPDTSLSSMEAGLASGLGSATSGASSEFLFSLPGGSLTLKSGAGLELAATGATFAFDQGLNIGAGVLDVMALGAVSQTAGTISAGDLLGSSHGGASLTASGNQFGALSGWTDAAGTIAVSDAQALVVNGTVSGGSAGISLVSTAAISESGSGAITTSGVLSLTSVGGASLAGANMVGSLSLANTGGGAVNFANAGAFSAASVSNAGGGALTLTTTSGGLNIDGPVSGGVVTLTSAGGISETGSGTITAANLTGSAVGATLQNVNMVGALGAFTANGAGLSLKDGEALVVDGAVSASGAVILSSTATVQESGASAAISAGGAISVTAVGGATLNGANTAAYLVLSNTGGGAVSYTEAGPLSVASASNAGGGALSLATSSGNLTITGPVAGGGVTLTSAGDLSESGSGAVTAATLTGMAGGPVALGGANRIGSLGAFTVTGGGLSLEDSQSLAVDAPVSAAGNVTLATTGSANITVDPGGAIVWASSDVLSLQAHANLILNGAISLTSSGTLDLGAGSTIAVDAPVTVSGAGTVNLTASGAGGSGLSFASGASIDYGATDNGGALTINGHAYTLLYTLSDSGLAQDSGTDDLAGIQNNSGAGGLGGDYALATSLTQAGKPFAQALVDGVFTGALQGLGHTITNLTIDASRSDHVGLFSEIAAGGSVSNLGLVGGSVDGSSGVGELAGVDAGDVTNTYATGVVDGRHYAGGLVGYETWGGQIDQSYATGTVNGALAVGGLVGLQHAGSDANDYATAAVSGGADVGGLVGDQTGGSTADTYAAGPVSGSAYVGGLVGFMSGGAIAASHWDTQATGQPSGLGGIAGGTFSATGLSTAQMQNGPNYATTFTGWNFTTIWYPPSQSGPASYPELRP